MKAITTRGDLYIEFNHVRPIKKGLIGRKCNIGDAGTYCILKDGTKEGTIISQGRAILHENDFDNFCYEKGRKLALRRAINNLFPGRVNKGNRQALWNAYINR